MISENVILEMKKIYKTFFERKLFKKIIFNINLGLKPQKILITKTYIVLCVRYQVLIICCLKSMYVKQIGNP